MNSPSTGAPISVQGSHRNHINDDQVPAHLPHSRVPLEITSTYLNTSEQEKLRAFFRILDREIMDNMHMIETTDGTMYPVTHVNLARVAYRILGMSPSALQDDPPEYSQYTIGSAVLMSDGWPLGHIEETMMQAVERLPGIITSIRNGQQPKNVHLHNIGYPSVVQGRVSDILLQESENDPNGALAKRLAGYVLSQPQAQETHIYGASMGANVAVPLGNILAQNGVELSVKLESPVSLQNSRVKLLKIGVGFFADILRDPNISSSRESMDPYITEQKRFQDVALVDHSTPLKEQNRNKGAFHRALLRAMGDDFPTPHPNISVTANIGKKDLSLIPIYGLTKKTPPPRNIQIIHHPQEHHLRNFFNTPDAHNDFSKLTRTLLDGV